MICDLCLTEITEDEIKTGLVIDYEHRVCGKHGWYHIICVLPLVENKLS